MSGLVNKIKEAVHSDKKHEQPTGTAGPHDSRAANAADPRVDSDRDHRANPATGTHHTTGATGTTGTTGTNTYGSSTTGTSGLGGDNFTQSGTGVTGAPGGTSTLGSSTTSSNRGPHDSNLANKADPRVDSDRDHRANPASNVGGTSNTYGSNTLGSNTNTMGTTGGEFGSSRTTGAGEFGSSGVGRTTRSGAEYGSATTGSGLGGSTGGIGSTTTSTNRGPHDSNLANKADPRVDSDRDHRANPASNVGGTSNTYGTTGTTGSSGLTGSHGTTGSSGLTGSHGTTGTTGTSGLMGSSGPAPNTAGPHKSDMMNKVDPRVDSDRDGSKTLGQDQTYARSSNTATTYNKDPTDAAQVPPSVLSKHLGEPSVEHGDHGHDRARRNSASTHQEAHRGL